MKASIDKSVFRKAQDYCVGIVQALSVKHKDHHQLDELFGEMKLLALQSKAVVEAEHTILPKLLENLHKAKPSVPAQKLCDYLALKHLLPIWCCTAMPLIVFTEEEGIIYSRSDKIIQHDGTIEKWAIATAKSTDLLFIVESIAEGQYDTIKTATEDIMDMVSMFFGGRLQSVILMADVPERVL